MLSPLSLKVRHVGKEFHLMSRPVLVMAEKIRKKNGLDNPGAFFVLLECLFFYSAPATHIDDINNITGESPSIK